MTTPYRRSVKGAILSEAPASATGREPTLVHVRFRPEPPFSDGR